MLISGKFTMSSTSSSFAPSACGLKADIMKSGIGINQKGRWKRRRDYADGQPNPPARKLNQPSPPAEWLGEILTEGRLPASRRQVFRSRIVSSCRQDAGSLEFGHFRFSCLGRRCCTSASRSAKGAHHTSPAQRAGLSDGRCQSAESAFHRLCD